MFTFVRVHKVAHHTANIELGADFVLIFVAVWWL